MIVQMKHVTVLCVAGTQKRTLENLREMGLMHLDFRLVDTDAYRDAEAHLEENHRASRVLASAKAGTPLAPAVAGSGARTAEQARRIAECLAAPLDALTGTSETKTLRILALADQRQELVNEAARLEREAMRVRPFGSFDVALPSRLAAEGIPVKLFKMQADAYEQAPFGKRLAEADRAVYGVLVGPGELPVGADPVAVPEAPLAELEAAGAKAAAKAEEIGRWLAAQADALKPELRHREQVLQDQRAFVAASDAMASEGAVAWISGWCPADREGEIRRRAKVDAWGLLIRDPEPDEFPPTMLRPPKWLSPMHALFKGLGIAPAYNEADVSLPFFIFFSIFFAMLVGDGGYGLVILGLSIWGLRKLRGSKLARQSFILLIAFATATVIWGALSDTWFGMHPGFLSSPASGWLGKDSNMMLLCFTLGVAHLSVARVWNAVVLFPDTKFLAQVGWLGVIWFMYFTAGNIVGVLPLPHVMLWVLGISILLIACFMLKKSELKTEGVNLGMLPLNVISCLGDIISYVRLFAVGLAGVKVAENFNQMATSLDMPLYLKIIPMVAILLAGHLINFAMAGLSVLVHAVRLNTLEFSNHKGIAWAGVPFTPFRKTTEL